MSIHVCECEHNGRTEYHLRYPGMSEQSAQNIADKINSGALDAALTQPASQEQQPLSATAFTSDQVQSAITAFLEFGQQQAGVGHKGYFSGGGWAATCLRDHLNQLKAQQPIEERVGAVMAHVHDLYAELGIKWGDNPFLAISRLKAKPASQEQAENRELRRMLCVAHAGGAAYTDDGEAQDSSAHPAIDYLRDSLDEIKSKRMQRASQEQAQQPSRADLEAAAKVCDGFAAPDMAAALRGQQPIGGEVVAWWYGTHPRPSIETIRLDHTFTDHAGEYIKGRPLVFGDTLTLATPKPEPMTQAMPQDMGHTTIMGDCIYAGIFEDEISEVKSAVVIKFESDDKLRDFLRWHHGITKEQA